MPAYTNVPDTPVVRGAGPKRDQLASKEPTPSATTWLGMPNWVPGHRYICMRGVPPDVGVSIGVEKLALLVPPPSAASART